jgi:maltooligosyltrehalose trehalohydrolase
LKLPVPGVHLVSGKEVTFVVWAPFVKKISLELIHKDDSKFRQEMEPLSKGYYVTTCEVAAKDEYAFLLNGRFRRPDPTSRYQPRGVDGPSSIVLPVDFNWHDSSWRGTSRSDLVIYELHVGTFSRKGTFEAVIPYLDYLKELGVTAIELMPVAQFSGKRNWGYDGVDLFAPQNSYGGPHGLQKLIDACHQKDLSVILDVVYNHLGPEGNFLGDFGPYFSYKYRTPWGPAVNYDESGSDEVRRFVNQNAAYWIRDYHVDGLRLDAIDKIFDGSPCHILSEIERGVHDSAGGREVHVIAESDLNDPKIIRSKETGGYAIDAQWSDDFHHSVHSYLTGERFGYYSDFGGVKDIEKSLSSAFVYDGRFSSYRGKTFGDSTEGLSGEKFVYCLQNHDQVGNHPGGERLSSLLTFDQLKVAVALLVFSQSIPMLFMGEEYAESRPFYYFVNHSRRQLIKSVREGRKKEHGQFDSEHKFADPQAESTFLESKLDHSLKSKGIHRMMLEYYRKVISVRNSLAPLKKFERSLQRIVLLEDETTIVMERDFDKELVKCIFVLGNYAVKIENPMKSAPFKKVFDSTNYPDSESGLSHSNRLGTSMDFIELSPMSAAVFAR